MKIDFYMLSIIDWINIGNLIASIYLTPLLFYYYRKTRIVDYLIFFAFYLNLGLYALATLGFIFYPDFLFSSSLIIQPSNNFLLNVLNFVASITPFLFYYFVILFFARGIDTKIARIAMKFVGLFTFLSVLIYIPLLYNQAFFLDINFQTIILIRFSFFVFITNSFLIILVDGLIELRDEGNFYFENRKTEIIWKIAIWFTIISCVGFLLRYIEATIEYFNDQTIYLFNSFYLTGVLSGLVGIGVVMFISLFNPKGLLVFRYQIVKAVSIYNKMEKQFNPNIMYHKSLSEIYEYLDILSNKFDI